MPDPFPLPGHQVGLPPVALNPVSSRPVTRPVLQGVPRASPAATPRATGTHSPAGFIAGGGRAWGCMAISTLLVLGVVGVLLANTVLGSARRGGNSSTTSSQSNGGGSTPTSPIERWGTDPYDHLSEHPQPRAGQPSGNQTRIASSLATAFTSRPNLACQSPVRDQGDVDVSVQMRQISGAPTDLNGIEVRRSGNPAS